MTRTEENWSKHVKQNAKCEENRMNSQEIHTGSTENSTNCEENSAKCEDCVTGLENTAKCSKTSGDNESVIKHLAESLEDIVLSEAELESLANQDKRLVTEFKANKLELEAQKNWDLFYKRNQTKFFKDRHWTCREFQARLFRGSTKLASILVTCQFLFFPCQSWFAFFVMTYDIQLTPTRIQYTVEDV